MLFSVFVRRHDSDNCALCAGGEQGATTDTSARLECAQMRLFFTNENVL